MAYVFANLFTPPVTGTQTFTTILQLTLISLTLTSLVIVLAIIVNTRDSRKRHMPYTNRWRYIALFTVGIAIAGVVTGIELLLS